MGMVRADRGPMTAMAVVFNERPRRQPGRRGRSRGVPVSASQTQARAAGAEDGLPSFAPRQYRTAVAGQARVRSTWWRRLCPSSFVLGGVTVLVVWVAVTALLRQGRLETVLSAGRAELAAPLL